MNNSFTLSEAEVVESMKMHARGSNRALAVLCLVGVALLLIGFFTPYKGMGFGLALGGVIGYFLILFILVPFNAKKQYKQHRALKAEMTVTFSDAGIHINSAPGESRLEWLDIHRWKYDKGIYLLYITSRMFHMIPSRALTNEAELRDLLVAHVGANKI